MCNTFLVYTPKIRFVTIEHTHRTRRNHGFLIEKKLEDTHKIHEKKIRRQKPRHVECYWAQ